MAGAMAGGPLGRSALVLGLAVLCQVPGTDAGFDSVHLMFDCVTDNIPWFQGMFAAAQEAMHFDSAVCFNSGDPGTVAAAFDAVLQRATGEARTAIVTHNRNIDGQIRRALEAGVAVFLIEYPFSLQDFGLTPNSSTMIRFLYDNEGAPTGKELCRLSGGAPQKFVIVKFDSAYGGPMGFLHSRIDGALRAFQKECPDVEITILPNVTYREQCDQGNCNCACEQERLKSKMRSLFLVESGITAVITAFDGAARSVVEAADAVLSPEAAERVRVTGFDNAAYIRPLVAKKRVTMTHDSLATQVGRLGMWNKIPRVLQEVGEMPVLSSEAIAEVYGLDESFTFSTPIVAVAADPEGYLNNQLRATYLNTVRARPLVADGPVIVHVGIEDMIVGEFDLKDGSFESAFWLNLQWQDRRLSWSPLEYNGSLHWPLADVWRPDTFLKNLESSQETVYESSATITNEGWVSTRRKVSGTFTCVLNSAPYPFTIHNCAIEVGVSADATVANVTTSLGLHIMGGPDDHYDPEVRTCDVADNVAVFRFRAVHKTGFVMFAYVFGAWLLNAMSFAQLYIPGLDDRTGLGMTTILAAMVLQMEARVSAVTSWLDIYLTASLIFQFSALLVSIHIRRDFYTHGGDPQTIQRYYVKASQQTRLVRLAMFLFGTHGTFAADRWSRRTQVPFYLVLTVLMPFFPRSGYMDISQHPDHGFSTLLFWLSATVLLFFIPPFLAVASGFVSISTMHMNEKGEEEVEDAEQGTADATAVVLRNGEEPDARKRASGPAASSCAL